MRLPDPHFLPPPSTLSTHLRPSHPTEASSPPFVASEPTDTYFPADGDLTMNASQMSSTGKGILVGMLSAFGSAAFVAIVFAIIYFFKYTAHGRIFLDRIGRPGEYDDEQAFLKEEAEALEEMDDLQRAEYLRAKAFIQANPPESAQTDISLSQFLAIQEKGVSAWEFEPELEIANCFVEGRTEVEFFDSECSVQSNLPIPKQNEVYYWEAKIYDKPETTTIGIGLTTKPYPLFRLPGMIDFASPQPVFRLLVIPGYHKTSIAYTSHGTRRFNQPFTGTPYGPTYVQGDVIGVGYRPRTGTIFFTRNGKKLEDVAHGLKAQNFFPTIGANGPCQVHVNFGQMGFVFIEANVKKWGLAPMTGSLAPPPPYGSEQGSILLEGGREGVREGMGYIAAGYAHRRSGSHQVRIGRNQPTSPGPQRSPTDISLAQLSLVDSNEGDVGEGTSNAVTDAAFTAQYGNIPLIGPSEAPPEYESPHGSPLAEYISHEESNPLLGHRGNDPPIPTYDAAIAQDSERRGRSDTRGSR